MVYKANKQLLSLKSDGRVISKLSATLKRPPNRHKLDRQERRKFQPFAKLKEVFATEEAHTKHHI